MNNRKAYRGPKGVQDTPAKLHPAEAEWDKTVAFYARTGRWTRDFGPDPMSPACKAPRHILDRHNINLETGKRQIPPRKVPAMEDVMTAESKTIADRNGALA